LTERWRNSDSASNRFCNTYDYYDNSTFARGVGKLGGFGEENKKEALQMKKITLVIHAPNYRVAKKSFEAVLKSGIGAGYAIYKKDISRLVPGCKVVLLRKDVNRKRAEGTLNKLVPTNRYTPQGIQRYDVHIEGLKVVAYKPEKLNRFGVAVLDC